MYLSYFKCDMPIVWEALTLWQPWREMIRGFESEFVAELRKFDDKLKTLGTFTLKMIMRRRHRLGDDLSQWRIVHLPTVNSFFWHFAEGCCSNLGNGLVAANHRSLDYLLKKKIAPRNLIRAWCRCGQKHVMFWSDSDNYGRHGRFDRSTTHVRTEWTANYLRCWIDEQGLFIQSKTSQEQGNRAVASSADARQAGNGSSAVATPVVLPLRDSTIVPNSNSSSRPPSQDPTPVIVCQSVRTSGTQDLRFLLLCVNVSKHGIILQHVNMQSTATDLDLIKAIR